ncbi:hypothetical protein IW140_002248 [Coemansia sp. RSA 1813]|nr:hypothetical protein EV178_001757 [Coemansia sp. RSA 1646]KAJ1770532.1 hypothetical protein LPJ74_003136 [Coemansia sp. RSA 1843]KAJ2092930.1 hypothetical protein IW138_000643 [Coemansia sp. RSA 986]KAJ2570576.1 hypothetical protein IW140_002248 [Coemansia sp. RSA 1813]
MRNISLSSRLQWAFRGSVLPGALATGDVDNDGCKEFVVGSVQGELAVFRGRGGCGSWQHSEDQIEPEFDCWDAVVNGQIPPEMLTHLSSEPASMRRQSTYNSLINGSASNRGSLSVEDILHLFEGGDRPSRALHAGSADTSEDEAGYGARRPSSLFDSEFTEHIKWEDALDIERDGRKPWILAQRLGTISSVVVADIANCGHNSIVVVNGEGKCYVFDYPFKRRLHPEMRKRRRQRNHYRRFSLERFFKDGVVVDNQELQSSSQDVDTSSQLLVSTSIHVTTAATTEGIAASTGQQGSVNGAIGTTLNSPSLGAANGSSPQPQLVRAKTALSDFPVANTDQQIGGQKKNTNSKSTPAMHDYENKVEQFEPLDLRPLGELALATHEARANNSLASSAVAENSDMHRKPNWRPISYAEMQRLEAQQENYPMGLSDGLISSGASSHPDLPLAILSKCDANEGSVNAFPESSDVIPCMTYVPTSPTMAKSMSGLANGGLSVATSNNSSGNNNNNNNGNRLRYISDVGVDSLSMAYADLDTESDQDLEDAMSDSDECPLLTTEEASDIEKMWGANVGKQSGDWFPFVLEAPDMTFDIPTNVEHAIVADVDKDGMNELVLTATDGFVYIFRVESPVKHEVKPTLATLGVLSNIPTTMPSANATGNGSPYLHMSAPRSPDASDLDLNESGKETKTQAGHASYTADKQPQKSVGGQDGECEPKSDENFEAAPDAGSDSASDLGLVNQLLKSIKDVSATPGDKKLGGSIETEATRISTTATTDNADMSDTFQRPSDASHVTINDTTLTMPQSSATRDSAASTQHRSSTGRRTSISSRVRESFNGIVSGWDVSRRTSGSCSHTANPSVEHSRAPTRNNSANSTKTHSRKPSTNDECADVQQPQVEIKATEESNEFRPREQRYLSSTYSSTSGNPSGEVHAQRARNNSICGGAGALQAIPERRSGDTERVDSISDIDSLAAREPNKCTGGDAVPKLNGLHASRAGNPSSRAHSRNGSITRSNAPSTRAHSRHGSITSVSSRPRIPSTTLHELDSTYALELRYGNSCRTSRRGSMSSNISTHESSTQVNGIPTQPAVPLEVVVSAQGSFSKPDYSHPPTNAEGTDDNNSVISQVTERLTELRFRPRFKKSANETSGVNMMPKYSKGKNNNDTYVDAMDRELLIQLPPSRGIVDWSSTSVDKVATWFLDNIPGNVSIVTAPVDAFGAPVARQGQALFSDDSSMSSCSTCECSMCGSDSEDSSDVFNDSSDRLAVAETTASKARVEPTAYKLGTNAAELSGLDLPKPLGLDALSKSKQAEPSNKPLDQSEEGSLDNAGQTDNLAVDLPETESKTVAGKDLQQFLILSKPGGRFVPIDMLNYAILSTVEPPPVPMSAFTGCNTAHTMNVDASNAARNAQLAASLGMSLQSVSTADVLGTSGSCAYQLPSWQSESMPWIQNIRPASYGSTGHIDKSPAGTQGAELPYTQNIHHSSSDISGEPSTRITEEPMISQFPSSGSVKSLSKSSGSADMHAPPQQFSAAPTSSSRRSIVSIGPPSMFNAAASVTGGTSISSNIRSIRSLHRISSDALRSQNFNAGHGPSPINRGMPLSGTMTPVGSGYPLGYGQYDRRQLGFAGLRGYIGNNINRQHTIGNPMLSARADDSSLLSGYFTPFAFAGQQSARPFSSGAGQGISYGTMPREPIGQVFSSSVSSNASVTNVNERAGGVLRYENARQNLRIHRTGSATPARNSASPQKAQHMTRYSPSTMVAWSSYKDVNMPTSIKDQDPFSRKDNVSRNSRHGHIEVESQAILETAPEALSLEHDDSNVLPGVITTTSPSTDIAAPVAITAVYGHEFWKSTEPASARSHSSLGTGTSGNYIPVSDVKGEEEIEEAPQPVAMDVTTFMVGGVTAGKRLRRILHGPAELGHNTVYSAKSVVSARYKEDIEGATSGKSESDMEDADEFEADELVSLVSMDCFISCYDPKRKISNIVNLNSKDPALGIWKIKMHEEISHPSPLETMLQDGCINLENGDFGSKLLSSTPAKRIYRRVGLSRHDLLHAVQYSSYIEGRVIILNKLENQRRKRARRMIRKVRSQTRMGCGAVGDKNNSNGSKRDGSSPGLQKGSALWRAGKAGLNGRLRDGLTRYHRVGQTVRNLGSQLRELATSSSTQQSAAMVDPASTALPVLTPHGAAHPNSSSVMQSEYTTPNLSLSPTTHKHLTNVQPQIHCSTSKPDANSSTGRPTSRGNVDMDSGRIPATSIDFAQPEISSSAGQHPSSSHILSSNAITGSLSNNLLDAAHSRRAFNSDLAATAVGWYGENKNDFRRDLRVADHLVVSTWRGTTYFVDVGTILDIAHYNELFTHRWTNSQAAASESVSAQTTKSYADILANTSEKDAGEATDYSGHIVSSIYGSLSEFADISGLVSRLRANASVVQFKFQETVSAFLADTYAPATGGPNVPCLFYVDYKDRIWVYYHLDEISEIDDVYGATWFRNELESQHALLPAAKGSANNAEMLNYDKPFSVVDLAYRRVSLDPWFPLPNDMWFTDVVSFHEVSYPYSFRSWRTHTAGGRGGSKEPKESSNTKKAENPNASVGTFYTHSDSSTNAIGLKANANATGSFHPSYIPGPFMCPIWADINSVDLYDVSVCNLIELVTPELLAMKDIFCKDIGINPDTVDEKVNLASIPGLANWVRSCLYHS